VKAFSPMLRYLSCVRLARKEGTGPEKALLSMYRVVRLRSEPRHAGGAPLSRLLPISSESSAGDAAQSGSRVPEILLPASKSERSELKLATAGESVPASAFSRRSTISRLRSE
jgi:hypothetical protein